MSNGTRPKVTKITVEFDNGATNVYPVVHGVMPIGLFWEDASVDLILAEFYGDGAGHTMTYDELKAHFGEVRARAVGQPGQTVTITRDVVKTIWRTADNGELLGVIAKLPRTTIG